MQTIQGLKQSTTKPWCFFHHALLLGWGFAVCVQWPFSSKHCVEHFSQKVQLLSHLSTAHFPRGIFQTVLGKNEACFLCAVLSGIPIYNYKTSFLEVFCCYPCYNFYFFITSFRMGWCIFRVIFAGHPLLGWVATVQSFCRQYLNVDSCTPKSLAMLWLPFPALCLSVICF